MPRSAAPSGDAIHRGGARAQHPRPGRPTRRRPPNSEIASRIRSPKLAVTSCGRLKAPDTSAATRSGKYHLGLPSFGLGHRALAGLDIREIAQPVLRQLVESRASRPPRHLDRGRAMYIEKTTHRLRQDDTWIGAAWTALHRRRKALSPTCRRDVDNISRKE